MSSTITISPQVQYQSPLMQSLPLHTHFPLEQLVPLAVDILVEGGSESKGKEAVVGCSLCLGGRLGVLLQRGRVVSEVSH